jgi:hypothetical protein
MSEFFPNSWHIFLSVVDNPPVMVWMFPTKFMLKFHPHCEV